MDSVSEGFEQKKPHQNLVVKHEAKIKRLSDNIHFK